MFSFNRSLRRIFAGIDLGFWTAAARRRFSSERRVAQFQPTWSCKRFPKAASCRRTPKASRKREPYKKRDPLVGPALAQRRIFCVPPQSKILQILLILSKPSGLTSAHPFVNNPVCVNLVQRKNNNALRKGHFRRTFSLSH